MKKDISYVMQSPRGRITITLLGELPGDPDTVRVTLEAPWSPHERTETTLPKGFHRDEKGTLSDLRRRPELAEFWS